MALLPGIHDRFGRKGAGLRRLKGSDPFNYATEIGLDPAVAKGLAILLIANDGNLASLSPRQREHYDKVVLPLLEKI